MIRKVNLTEEELIKLEMFSILVNTSIKKNTYIEVQILIKLTKEQKENYGFLVLIKQKGRTEPIRKVVAKRILKRLPQKFNT